MTIRRASNRVLTVSLLAPLGLLVSCGAQSQDSRRQSQSDPAPGSDAGERDAGASTTNGTSTTQVGPTGSTTGFTPGAAGTGSSGTSGSTGGSGGSGTIGGSGATGGSGTIGGSGATGSIGVTGPSGATWSGPSGSSGGSGGTLGPSGAVVGPTGWGSTGASGPMAPVPVSFLEPWELDETCTADALSNCSDIALANRYTAIGGYNQLPTIEWTPGPEGTASYALSFEDLNDATAHWVMWNVPAANLSVGANFVPESAKQTALVGAGWLGPDACDHVYELVVYAIGETSIDVQPDTPIATLHEQLKNDDSVVLAKDYVRLYPRAPCGN